MTTTTATFNEKNKETVKDILHQEEEEDCLSDMHDRIDDEIDRLVGMDLDTVVDYSLFKNMIDPLSKKSVYEILINPEKSENVYREMYQCDNFDWYEYQRWINHIIKLGNHRTLNLIWKAIYYCDRNNPDFESDYKYACKYGSYSTFVKTMEGLFWNTLDGFEDQIFVQDVIELTKGNARIDQQRVKDLFEKYEKVVIEQKMILAISLVFKEWDSATKQYNENQNSVSDEWKQIIRDSARVCEDNDQYDNYHNGYKTVQNVFKHELEIF